MWGPKTWHCLFMLLPIILKQLNSLTEIDTFSWLVGWEVMFQTVVQKDQNLILGSGKDFYMSFFCFVILLIVQKTLFTCNFAIACAMLIHFVYLTYCKRCDQL